MIWAGVLLLAVVSGVVAWNIWFSATRIAFVNYQATTLGQIARANDHRRIRLASVDPSEFGRLGRYDAVLMNGMGLRITADERAALQRAADRGLTVITTMATNPANEIVSADSATLAAVKGYLNGGGRRNYRNLLAYLRRTVDGKRFDTDEPEPPVVRELKQFYHADPSDPEAEELDFDSVEAYEAFLAKHGLLKPDAPRVIVTGQMGEPAELVARLEETGNVVYSLRSLPAAIHNGQADSIRPSAVINMAHGRLGDAVVEYLTRQNIPLFSPLNVNRLVGEWEADKMGMSGGFLSQSVVMPEIDGAIRSQVLFGHRLDKEGLQQVHAIPERLERFVGTVNRHIALQRKPNREKRVAIYYYKGPGQNALTASGMEVTPSLYNLLVRLRSEGYRVENLPASPEGLAALIQQQGAVFNAYAHGAKADFLKDGNPALISAGEYAAWCAEAVPAERMEEVRALDGEFPGGYLSDDAGRLALPRIELGNVVLLPQLAAGAGDDDFAIVHGTDAAPPHAYIASYLWARYAFRADAIVHFGTHGSLEFTPRKQVALSGSDWPDALIGPTPHLYVYSIGNVGDDRQAPLVCRPAVVFDPSFHGERRARHLPRPEHGDPELQRPALRRRTARYAGRGAARQAADRRTGHPPRAAARLAVDPALYRGGDRPHRVLCRGTGRGEDHRRTLYDGPTLFAGTYPQQRLCHVHRADRLFAAGARQIPGKGILRSRKTPHALHAPLPRTGPRTGRTPFERGAAADRRLHLLDGGHLGRGAGAGPRNPAVALRAAGDDGADDGNGLLGCADAASCRHPEVGEGGFETSLVDPEDRQTARKHRTSREEARNHAGRSDGRHDGPWKRVFERRARICPGGDRTRTHDPQRRQLPTRAGTEP